MQSGYIFLVQKRIFTKSQKFKWIFNGSYANASSIQYDVPTSVHMSSESVKILANLDYVYEIFEEQVNYGIYPHIWKHTIITVILKPGKVGISLSVDVYAF